MVRVKRSYLEVKHIIENEGYTLVSSENDIMEKNGIVKQKTKLQTLCDKGHEYITNFDNFYNGKTRCKKCKMEEVGNNKAHSLNYISSELNKIGFRLLSETYKNVDEKIVIVCENGHNWKVPFKDVIRRKSCPYCKQVVKLEDKKQKIIRLIEDYGYNFVKFNIDKDKCFTHNSVDIYCDSNHFINKKISSVMEGKLMCPICYGKQKKHLNDVIEEFESYDYKVISHNGYENNQSRFLLTCENNHVWDTTYANFKSGSRCPECIKPSKGESSIMDYLEKNNIEYFYQYSFDDCKFKQVLPFDFYIPNKNILIEFDGEQHYKIIKHFGGFDKFVDTKIRDTIKNLYCVKNNIELLRISYCDYNKISKILNEKL